MNLNHFVIKSNNIELMKDFYGKLGFAFEFHKHGSGPFHYSSTSLNIIFEIYPTNNVVTNHISMGISIANLEDYHKNLLEKGIDCSEIKDLGYGKNFVIRDIDNNRIEIYEKE